MSGTGQGVYNPITPQALIIINAVVDFAFMRSRMLATNSTTTSKLLFDGGDKHNYACKRHELSFMNPHSRSHLNTSSHLATSQNDVPIFTSFNGISLQGLAPDQLTVAKRLFDNKDKSEAAMEELYRWARKLVRFVGVNLTDIDASNLNQKGSVALVVAGMITVINTGPERLGLMEKVCWDVPYFTFDNRTKEFSNKYLPNSKLCAQIVPYNTAIRRNLKDAPARIGKAVSPESRDREDNLSNEREIGESFIDLVSVIMFGGKNKEEIRQKLAEALIDKNDAGYGVRSYPARDAMTRFLKHARHVCDEVDERVIGTSTTAAFPGQMCDIILRHVV